MERASDCDAGLRPVKDEGKGGRLGRKSLRLECSSDVAYMWNLKKNDTNELLYKTEIESQR